jgi:hypothetical protein
MCGCDTDWGKRCKPIFIMIASIGNAKGTGEEERWLSH